VIALMDALGIEKATLAGFGGGCTHRQHHGGTLAGALQGHRPNAAAKVTTNGLALSIA
jgi:pimeloyl-ACP methyl ester carboxylesterase